MSAPTARSATPPAVVPATSYDSTPEFGALYDAVPLYAERTVDVSFYFAEAARSGANAPVLELGCGTGRVSLPLARAGHPVVGLDSSASMLERFRAKLATEPLDLRAKVVLHQADIRNFTVSAPGAASSAGAGSGFRLAIAPFRVFQHLTTIADQLRCLSAIRRHLAPGGRFAFDVFNPKFSLMTADRSNEKEDTPALTLPDGRTLRRTGRVLGVHWTTQILDVELIYYLGDGRTTERIVHAFEMRWFTPSELEHLLARSGFRVEAIFGDYDRRPLSDSSPDIVVVAVNGEMSPSAK